MAIKKEIVRVTNIKNGGHYWISVKKLKSEPGQWETYVAPAEKVVVEEVEEDLGGVGSEMSRDEIKLVLKAADVDFKGNASTESLLQLLEESI